MKRIGLLSDTHGFLDKSLFTYFEECDEIWHAGDIGNPQVLKDLEAFRPVRAVYGNIDGGELRHRLPEDLFFECEGLSVWLTHIGGYPGRYDRRVREKIRSNPPDLFICGHSHILKVMPDKKNKLIHINPGACGQYGFHVMRTVIRFSIDEGKIKDMEVVELGRRGAVDL